MEKMLKLEIMGKEVEVPAGSSFEQIVEPYQEEYEGMIALVAENGKIRELFKKATNDCKVDFFTLKDAVGHKTYVRTTTMLALKAIHDVFGVDVVKDCRTEFSVGNGLYITSAEKIEPTEANAMKIKNRMLELVEKKVPFIKKSFPMDEAVAIFKERGMTDKTKLFRYRRSSSVNVYEVEGYFDYYYGFMLPNTGYVKWFDFVAYEKGFMLVLPSAKEPKVIKPFQEKRKLFDTLNAASKWGHDTGIENVGELNDMICGGSLSDMILVQEAEQERKIGEIARMIAARPGVKFVMIAGPSSSGKTSFSHRLSIQLRTLGLTPHPIALDDYFVNREDTPRDEKGDYNFECLEAIDINQFNEDMTNLLAGKRVELPTFNFKIGQREYHGNYMQLGADDILVLEGIHGLNPKMSYALPDESKFKIYISALMNLNIDSHNRIPTTDGRLIRRMVRDARTRGASAQRTIQMWPSVRKGEEENIFPFQEEADVMFNSSMIFELSVLKQYAEPLLFHIEKDQPEYYEAKRLLKFLEYFLGVSSEELPHNSICREFVGGSCFRV